MDVRAAAGGPKWLPEGAVLCLLVCTKFPLHLHAASLVPSYCPCTFVCVLDNKGPDYRARLREHHLHGSEFTNGG